MTLTEAKDRFEKGKDIWSADQYRRWAQYLKTGQGDPWPMFLAPTGELFRVMCSGGEKQEGAPFPSYYDSENAAVEAWSRCVSDLGYRMEKPVVYWRSEPELAKVPRGYVVYSRLCVSDKGVTV